MKSLACQIHQCDLSSESSIQAFAKNFKGKPLDLILNSAGVLQLSISRTIPAPSSIADAVGLSGIMAPHERDTLETTTHSILLRTFYTNTFGPLLLTQALLPSLRLSPHPRIGLMSSALAALRTTAPAVDTPTGPPKRPSTVLGRAWRWTRRGRA